MPLELNTRKCVETKARQLDSSLPRFWLSAHHAGSSRAKRNIRNIRTPHSQPTARASFGFNRLYSCTLCALHVLRTWTQKAGMRPWPIIRPADDPRIAAQPITTRTPTFLLHSFFDDVFVDETGRYVQTRGAVGGSRLRAQTSVPACTADLGLPPADAVISATFGAIYLGLVGMGMMTEGDFVSPPSSCHSGLSPVPRSHSLSW